MYYNNQLGVVSGNQPSTHHIQAKREERTQKLANIHGEWLSNGGARGYRADYGGVIDLALITWRCSNTINSWVIANECLIGDVTSQLIGCCSIYLYDTSSDVCNTAQSSQIVVDFSLCHPPGRAKGSTVTAWCESVGRGQRSGKEEDCYWYSWRKTQLPTTTLIIFWHGKTYRAITNYRYSNRSR